MGNQGKEGDQHKSCLSTHSHTRMKGRCPRFWVHMRGKQQNVQSEALQTEKANTKLSPGKKGQREGMTCILAMVPSLYASLNIPDNEEEKKRAQGKKNECASCAHTWLHWQFLLHWSSLKSLIIKSVTANPGYTLKSPEEGVF